MPLSKTPRVRVRPVDSDNWRAVSALEVTSEQRAFVAEPSYYLALCCYGTWNRWPIYLGGTVVGFLMWGIDDDKSCWLGGILIDRAQQRQGYGRAAVKEAIAVSFRTERCPGVCALLPARQCRSERALRLDGVRGDGRDGGRRGRCEAACVSQQQEMILSLGG